MMKYEFILSNFAVSFILFFKSNMKKYHILLGLFVAADGSVLNFSVFYH